MEKEKITGHITSGRNAPFSDEFRNWLRSSEENQQEFIRSMNAWALVQRGEGMDEQQIAHGLKKIKSRLKMSANARIFFVALRYASVILIAFVTGYFLHTPTITNEITLNEVTVPNGNRSFISLSDGTTVWLTNGSRLVYPDKFEGNSREVLLEGEAYFAVAQNESKPFVVSLGEHRVKVLGTRFSAMAYPGDDLIQVDLVSGMVQVEISHGQGEYITHNVKPLHSFVFDKSSGMHSQTSITDGFYSYWQNGIYAFTDKSFESLVAKIQRIYGVEVIFEDDGMKQRTFTGTFGIDDNLYTMMEIFKRASARPFEYRIDKKRIYIKKSLN